MLLAKLDELPSFPGECLGKPGGDPDEIGLLTSFGADMAEGPFPCTSDLSFQDPGEGSNKGAGLDLVSPVL